MTEFVLPAIANGVAVFLGLFLLWSFATGMRRLPTAFRARAALVAGSASALLTLIVTALVAA